MGTKNVISTNFGTMIYATRIGEFHWDYYWKFPVPEGLTGVTFKAHIAQNALVFGTMALFPPGTNPQSTTLTDANVRSKTIYPSDHPSEELFLFDQPGLHYFTFRGSPSEKTPEINSKVWGEITKGLRPSAFIDLEIIALHYAEHIQEESLHFQSTILDPVMEVWNHQVQLAQLEQQLPQNRAQASQQGIQTPQNVPTPPIPSAPVETPIPPQSYDNISLECNAQDENSQPKIEYHTHIYTQENTNEKRGCRKFFKVIGIIGIIAACLLLATLIITWLPAIFPNLP